MRTPSVHKWLILLCAVANTGAMAGEVYRCEKPGAPVSYQPHPCDGSESEKVFHVNESLRQSTVEHSYNMTDHHLKAWQQLCSASSRNADYVGRCVADQRKAYQDMRKVLNSGATEQQAARVHMCYQRWFKVAIDAVDARMWSYCYYH